MSWPYAYTPYIWPMLACALVTGAIGVFSYRRRARPGALPLAVTCLFLFLWAAGAVMEMAGADAPTRIFWSKFQAVWKLPSVTAGFCFVLEYVDPGRWVNRRTLALLAVAPLLAVALYVTNDTFHLAWVGFTSDPYPQPIRGVGVSALTVYMFLLAALQVIALLSLFVRSPLHRWPAVLILLGQLEVRVAYFMDTPGMNPAAPMDPSLLAVVLASGLYALALFRFHLFELLPFARETGVEQMQEGMAVLNAERCIADLNPAAERILGIEARKVRGQKLEALPECSGLLSIVDHPDQAPSEICIGTGENARYYALHLTQLKDRRDVALGHLILLHDVTEQKHAHAKLLEQQRTLATVAERERLARELHDSIGQVVGFINVQAQAARDLLARGENKTVDDYLARMARVAQDANADIRESILALRSTAALEHGLVAVLDQYLRQFGQNYDLHTELTVPDPFKDRVLEPWVELQVLRIIQEALANARKHARARCVCVHLTLPGDRVQAVVEDDGQGFDVGAVAGTGREKFGLHLMRERAQQVGGNVTIDSAIGKGTRVLLEVPLNQSGGSPVGG